MDIEYIAPMTLKNRLTLNEVNFETLTRIIKSSAQKNMKRNYSRNGYTQNIYLSLIRNKGLTKLHDYILVYSGVTKKKNLRSRNITKNI